MDTKIKLSTGERIFKVFNCTLMVFLALLCLIPIINVLAVSLSSSYAVSAGEVTLFPVGLTLESYKFVVEKPEFMRAFWVSVKRVLVGVPVNMLITILIAYPLSKENEQLAGRKLYVWFFVVAMLFSGGLIPWYMTISKLGLVDSFWAMILPCAVSIYNVMILMNFFRDLPPGLVEAAELDGASHLRILFQIVVPLSLPSIATLTLFSFVMHWNSWFDGLLLMNSPGNYPLQSYLQTVIVNRDMSLMSTADILSSSIISDRTSRAAQTLVASLPVLVAYPLLHKYFAAGIVIGSVKE